jgi:hypothetical protein
MSSAVWSHQEGNGNSKGEEKQRQTEKKGQDKIVH